MKETVKHFFIESKSLPISVSTTGISVWDKDQCYERKKPEFTIIEYVFGGEGTIVVDGKKIEVKADQIYILPAGISHKYYTNSKNTWSKMFMNMSGNLAHSLLGNYNLNKQYVFTAPALKPLFEDVMQTSFANIPEAIKQAKLVSIYVEILHRLSQLNVESHRSSEAISLKNYLDENYSRVISNSELANQIYRSTDFCLKLFKREFGTTPYDYQISNKIRIASSLLQNTRKSIAEISEIIGYQNPHYFTSMFKARTGMTPTAYRNQFK